MNGNRVRSAAAVALIAGVVAGCGSDDGTGAKTAVASKTVRGETETGMKLSVQPFVAPSAFPEVKQLEAIRAAGRYPAVDFHRVVADNTQGQMPDRERLVLFGKSTEAVASGQLIQPRFACDVLKFEWHPNDATKPAYKALRSKLCPFDPETADSIPPGGRQVYYLVTDRGFAERGIKSMKLFGPRSVELR